MKFLFALVTLISLDAWAAPVPVGHRLQCWDGTFAYNRFDVQEKSGTVQMEISGQNLATFTQLTGEKGWGQLSVVIALPAGNCFVSKADPKLLSCATEKLTMIVTNLDRDPQAKRTITMDHASVSLRKIVEAGTPFDPDEQLTAYELSIRSYDAGQVTKYVQTFSSFIDPDSTIGCKLN